MKKLVIDEGVEHQPEGPQANVDTPEETIFLPERAPDSVAHVPIPRLANPDQAKDFEKQVFTD